MLEGVRRPPLGIEPLPAVEATLQLNPGDALVLFSDGLAEEPSAARDGDRKITLGTGWRAPCAGWTLALTATAPALRLGSARHP